MECVLLGCGGMAPMPYRALTSLAVRLGGGMYLFDAGEGTQVLLKRSGLGIKRLRLLAVTHLHGDHSLGLFGLLMMRSFVPDAPPLTVVGPPGLRDFVSVTQHHLGFQPSFSLELRELEGRTGGVAHEDSWVRVLWAPLKHTSHCLGYRLEEQPPPGRFDPEAAISLEIPKGPLWGRLQRGEPVFSETGTLVHPSQVLGPARAGRSVAYAVDTRPCPNLSRILKGADLAFVDGMFDPRREAEAHERGHMTMLEAAREARKSGVKRLILVHLSPRYLPEDLPGLIEAARKIFPSTEPGQDLARYPVPIEDI